MSGPVKLRAEVVIEPSALRDPLLGRTITLGPTGVALAQRLGEAREVAALIDELIAAGFQRATIEDTLRCFTLLHLLDGIGDRVRDRLRAIWAGETELALHALPEARFECQGSGMCCRSYRLGPVAPEEAARIRALPDVPAGELFVTHDDRLYLATRDARCVFLQDDNRCGLHARHGAEAKPMTCRTYPLAMKLTFEAAVVYNNHHCATHFTSQDRGPTLLAASHLLRARRTGPVTIFHPIVFVREDTPVDYSHFLTLEAALRDVVGQGVPFAQLAHAVTVIESFVAAARGFPIGDDPAAALAAWRSQIAVTGAAPAPSATDWELTAVTLAQLIRELSVLLQTELGDNVDRDMVPLVIELIPILEALHVRAVARSELAAPLADALASSLRRSLVEGFQGALSLPEDRPLVAIGQAALAIACGFAAGDLSRGHALAMRVLPTFTTPLFRAAPDRVRALTNVLDRLARDMSD